MRKLIAPILALSVLLIAGCAVEPISIQNEAERDSFEAWIALQKQLHPEYLWKKTPLGSYIIDSNEPQGTPLVGKFTDHNFIYLGFTAMDKEGHVISTTDEEVARRNGVYKERSYYGPRIWLGSRSTFVGLEEAVEDMHVGGTRTVIIPKWLTMNYRYDTAEEYLQNKKNKQTEETRIYTITIADVFDDIDKWEIDSLETVAKAKYGIRDSLIYGLYSKVDYAPSDWATVSDGDTLQIFYTGRLLNGKVFDTNVKEVAMTSGLFNKKTQYIPMNVTWREEYTEIGMSSSASETDLIEGFQYAVHMMKPGEKLTVLFYSGLGYGDTDNGNIPAYSPLIFELEAVDPAETE